MSLVKVFGRTRSVAAAVGIAAVAYAAAAPGVTASGTRTHGGAAARISATIDPALRDVTGTAHVIVRGAASAEQGVTNLGGKVTHQLPLIGGFAASVPAGNIDKVAKLPGVTGVSADSHMSVQAATLGQDTGGAPQPANVYQDVIHATDLKAAGNNGQGVTVALIDTGVTSMPDTSSRLVKVVTSPSGLVTANCVNFTGDGTCDDKYGHGTFLAGLIAGTGSASNGQYAGVAPSAKILSVKIAGADGSADVSTVIAALQWVIAFRNIYGIKVLNLSLGSNSDQPYSLSPLDFAVEKAWQSGITVVVSASNLGPAAQTIDKPADDPYVITVGATDDEGTVDTSDDGVPNFSAHGPTKADGLTKPDLAAPGAHLVSLAAPGATITTQFPPDMTAPYRRGSGTSMSTAVMSGLIADVLSAKPSWTPDRVKWALTTTATAAASNDPNVVGAGIVNGFAALSASPGLANQGIPLSTGVGTIEADRGSVHVQAAGASGNVVASPLSGEITAQLAPWSAAAMLYPSWNGNQWYGNQWYGNQWYGNQWYGNQWYGNQWYGNQWYGNQWYGNQWYGNQWYGNQWYGSAWYGSWG